MVLNPTMMDDLYYCGWECYDGQNVFRSITDFAFDNSFIHIRRFFDVSFMLDLIFDNKQKRPPISIIPILTLKNGPWLQQCNKEEENSVVFPAKNALYLKNCQLSCISVIVWKWLKNVSIYNVANIFWIPKRNNCVICAQFWRENSNEWFWILIKCAQENPWFFKLLFMDFHWMKFCVQGSSGRWR